MNPRISIIIPTHNRAEALRRVLLSLARQSAPPDQFEVIAVADGSTDDTARVARSLVLPYRFTFIEQLASGAAAARNRGAREASAPLLLFLDDDMEASRRLVRAHLAAHAAHPDSVVLGYFPIANPEERMSLLEVITRLWWDEGFRKRARADHRFTFRDCCTGNLSLPRHLFEEAGGFDPRFGGKAGEDYDLGMWLIKRRVRFQFVREAESLHHDHQTQARMLKRATAEGRGDILLVDKHPELFFHLPIGRPVSGRIRKPLWHLIWRFPLAAALVAMMLRGPMALARALKLRGLWERLWNNVHFYAYWRGVRQELGELGAWRRRLQDAPIEPSGAVEIDIDLESDLPRLEEILRETPADAARLRFGPHPIARIAPLPGAEPLRPMHIQRYLLDYHAITVFGHMLARRLGARDEERRAAREEPAWNENLHWRVRPAQSGGMPVAAGGLRSGVDLDAPRTKIVGDGAV